MALCLQSAATGPSVATLDLSDCRPVMEMPQVHIPLMCGPADLSLPKWRNSPYLQPYLTSELYLYMSLPQSHLKTCSFSALNILYQNSLTKPTKKNKPHLTGRDIGTHPMCS